MKGKRFSKEQIIGVLKEHEAGVKTADLSRKHAITNATYCDLEAAPASIIGFETSWSNLWGGLADRDGATSGRAVPAYA